MTPHKQLNLHDPSNGLYGDCGRTAIACLLDIEPAEVPHFYDRGVEAKTATRTLDQFLKPRGLREVNLLFPGDCPLQDVLTTMLAVNPGLHYLLVGESLSGCDHVVVCCDDAIVHDPSQVDAGIVGPAADGYWWITFLGARL